MEGELTKENSSMTGNELDETKTETSSDEPIDVEWEE